MTRPTLAVHTIGQTPRPDLITALGALSERWRLDVHGALDGLTPELVPGADPRRGYPLETRLRDGSHVIVELSFVHGRLQRAIADADDRVSAHVVLCAAPFDGLAARAPVIVPFEAGASELVEAGHHSLEVVVPFAAQGPAAAEKWRGRGFTCRVHALTETPSVHATPRGLTALVSGSDADALVFDYVGFPTAVPEAVARGIGLPVVDLGASAVRALEHVLEER